MEKSAVLPEKPAATSSLFVSLAFLKFFSSFRGAGVQSFVGRTPVTYWCDSPG